MADRYPLIGVEQGVVLVAGRLFGPGGKVKNVILLLDTGASITAIRAAVLAQVGIDLSQPREQRQVETMGGPVIEGIVDVPRLRVFGQEREQAACRAWGPILRDLVIHHWPLPGDGSLGSYVRRDTNGSCNS